MKLYAEVPHFRNRQIRNDLLVALWSFLWIRAGMAIHDLVTKLAGPGDFVERAGRRWSGGVTEVGGRLAEVPLVGDDIQSGFERLAGAGDFLRNAGQAQQNAVHDLALWLGLLLALIPISIVVLLWLPRRLRWMREAAAASHIRVDADDLHLFALRAIARRSLEELRSATPDPAKAYATGDYEPLAALELQALGLRTRHA
jgi:hypothetical protein